MNLANIADTTKVLQSKVLVASVHQLSLHTFNKDISYICYACMFVMKGFRVAVM